MVTVVECLRVSGQDYGNVKILVNNNEDFNEWIGGCCCSDGYVPNVLILVVLSKNHSS